MSLDVRARILISGLVQGVLFRRGIADLAIQLGVTGWVRNLPDGSVEVICEGDKDKLDKVIQFCHIGPSGARVRNVVVDWFDFKGDFRGFKITR
jgi:acylphosphatase